MFTGIIKSIGYVSGVKKTSGGMELKVIISASSGDPSESTTSWQAGDSLAINGACLTVKSIKNIRPARRETEVAFDAVQETLKRTNLGDLKVGSKVNLEPAIRAGEPFGGHFVQGHIDGTGIIKRKAKTGNGYLMEVNTSPELTEQMIAKGSVAVDGISLTLVSVKKGLFSIAIIPFTIQHTNFKDKKAGDKVNIEADILGKWVRKMMGPSNPSLHQDKPINREILEELL